jgi:ubiquinone/menaquinone biosynthesis C-methylase UbiE
MIAARACTEDEMRSTEELKQIFQEGWNVPARVDNYVRNVAEAEFTEGECCDAWQETLRDAIGGSGQLQILDVGTGPGVFACLYAQMGHRCIGLDFSRRMLAEATQRARQLGGDCQFVFGDAEQPPFEAATFDVVSSRHVLFNLPRPGVALREWCRVLKPGGRMVLIGDEPEQRSGRTLSAPIRRLVGWYRGRRMRRGAGGWRPRPGYLKAVSECPLFRNSTPEVLRTLMEAIGLCEIHLGETEAIHAARLRRPRSRWGRRARPFILVGQKPLEMER